MCGICGIVDFCERPDTETIERMSAALQHRGPDASGLWGSGACILGHRRLSVVDLSDSANQPMLSPDGSTAVVFNGEIYNFREIRERLEQSGHRFRTNSDTEVLLKLYLEKKEGMLNDLNGMFSIGIWNAHEERLFLARDRMGKKPLYYRHDTGRLSFSSELTSLLCDSHERTVLCEPALYQYLLYDFIPAPFSIFQEILKLPAAHAAIFDRDGLKIWRYWKPPHPEYAMDYVSSVSTLEELLHDAVRRRMIADVPLGSFLSGGLDSTLVTSLMTEKSPLKIKTFSISFPGTSHDESQWSSLAASSLKTDHKTYPVEYDIEKVFSRMVRHFGEPFGDSSAIPTWHLCERTRDHVTVALSGDGGDELFGGYDRYLARRFQLLYDIIPRVVREKIVEPLIDRLPATTDYYGTSPTKKLKLFTQAARRMRREPLAVVPRTFSPDEVTALTGMVYPEECDPVLAVAREWTDLDPVSHMLLTDLQTYLAEDILTKVDRMSMAHALEVRSPLLDHRVVEFACRIPLGFKIRGRTSKRILKAVAERRIPQTITNRSKYGFQVPLGRWFKTNLREWALERLLEASHSFFDKSVVQRIWEEHQQGRADNAHKIWLLLFFNEWYDQFQ